LFGDRAIAGRDDKTTEVKVGDRCPSDAKRINTPAMPWRFLGIPHIRSDMTVACEHVNELHQFASV
jgi:hypothetical protein